MSTLTPTSDSRQILEVSSFQIGDRVVALASSFINLPGVITQLIYTNGTVMQVRVDWINGDSSTIQTKDLRKL